LWGKLKRKGPELIAATIRTRGQKKLARKGRAAVHSGVRAEKKCNRDAQSPPGKTRGPKDSGSAWWFGGGEGGAGDGEPTLDTLREGRTPRRLQNGHPTGATEAPRTRGKQGPLGTVKKTWQHAGLKIEALGAWEEGSTHPPTGNVENVGR